MAGDLPGGPTELDNYNGYLLALAGERDIPLNRAVYEMASRIEKESLAPGLRWLEEIVAATARA